MVDIKNIKSLTLPELEKVYDDIVNIGEVDYLFERIVNGNFLKLDKSIRIHIGDKSLLNYGSKFILNKNKHSVTCVEFVGIKEKVYYLHKDFLEIKNLRHTILYKIYVTMMQEKNSSYAKIIVDVDRNYTINIIFNNIIAKLANMETFKEEFDLKVTEAEKILKMIPDHNNHDYIFNLKDEHMTFTKQENKDFFKKDDLYYCKFEEVKNPEPVLIRIRNDIIEQYNQTPIEKATINIRKIIRLNEFEFNLLNDADRTIYNNIEKYIQLYTSGDVTFDSVLASIKYVEKIEKKIKNDKVSKVINRFKESLNTFKIHYVITPEDYERSNQCEHMRRGHERRYKSGKVIWIDSYRAGKNKQGKKDE